MTGDAAELLAQAVALHRAGRLDEAQALYREVLVLQPQQLDALHWRGAALRDLGRAREALVCIDGALAIDPAHAKAWANRAAALLDLGRAQDALDAIDRSLALDPGDAAARYNRASALEQLGRHRDALAACEHALERLPEHPDLLDRHGRLLRVLGRPQAALASFERAVALAPGDAGLHLNRGHALADLGRHDEAAQAYARAWALAPELPYLLGHLLHARLKTCDWDGLETLFAQLGAAIDAGRPACEPFVTLFTPLSAAQQRRCAEIHVRHAWPDYLELPRPRSRDAARIHLGYFSADFREHATAQLLAGVLEQHDRRRVEVTAFAFGAPVDDVMRTRLRAGVDRFIDVHERSDAEIVALARELGVQIAIDLGGHTRGARSGVFARRAAPLQVAWLGYPGTLGAPFIDYLVADPVVLPAAQTSVYREQIAWLPHCYQPNDDRRAVATRHVTRRECGLPDEGFVFCCFNQPAKIAPKVFEVWMGLLRDVPGSVLWLLQVGSAASDRLRKAAGARGVAPERLVFAPRIAPAEHLARHRVADLFIDTWPCNAHTTASDALWGGLPVLTCIGETFAGRVGASLLHAVGLPELVTRSTAEYAALAVTLATDPPRLEALRERLAAQRSTAPLFDTTRFTRDLEAAFAAMWTRHAGGEPPASFAVSR